MQLFYRQKGKQGSIQQNQHHKQNTLVKRLSLVQQGLAHCLTRKTNSLSASKLKGLTFLFFLLFGSTSILVAVRGFEEKSNAFIITSTTPSLLEYPARDNTTDMMVSKEVYTRLQRYKSYLD